MMPLDCDERHERIAYRIAELRLLAAWTALAAYVSTHPTALARIRVQRETTHDETQSAARWRGFRGRVAEGGPWTGGALLATGTRMNGPGGAKENRRSA